MRVYCQLLTFSSSSFYLVFPVKSCCFSSCSKWMKNNRGIVVSTKCEEPSNKTESEEFTEGRQKGRKKEKQKSRVSVSLKKRGREREAIECELRVSLHCLEFCSVPLSFLNLRRISLPFPSIFRLFWEGLILPSSSLFRLETVIL